MPAVGQPAEEQSLRSANTEEAELARQHAREVSSGQRFEFGKNWSAFLTTLDDDRIRRAEQSLREMLGVETLAGKTFVDIGSGSGLFSLAARNLGASVTSFDYDPNSVACTRELRRRYWADDPSWRVEAGSALDPAYTASLGTFDVVYSWGVLHHTGQMWTGIENAMRMVKPRGLFFIAIYNDQGVVSNRWRAVKQMYCKGGLQRAAVVSTVIPYWAVRTALSDLVRLRSPLRGFREYRKGRGMSITHDWYDWLGGFPFEVAKPEEIILRVQREGFTVTNLVTQRGTMGCVEYVFRRDA